MIDLVDREEHRLAGDAQLLREVVIDRGQARATVDDEEQRIGLADRPQRLAVDARTDHLARGLGIEPAGVDDAQRRAEVVGVAVAAVKIDRTDLAVGGKVLVSDFEIELDYLNTNKKHDPQTTQLIDNLSAVALVRYKMETGSVHLKYENSATKTALTSSTDTKSTITGMTAAYEFKPVKDENWRAHVALTQKDTKPENADTQSEKIVYVGTRILADFLKM